MVLFVLQYVIPDDPTVHSPLMVFRETPVGYALLKAKSSKILNGDGFSAEDQTAEGICSLYVYEN